MPLYECTVCHSVENTALANFWFDVMHEDAAIEAIKKGPPPD